MLRASTTALALIQIRLLKVFAERFWRDIIASAKDMMKSKFAPRLRGSALMAVVYVISFGTGSATLECA